jgi:RNA polymerase sigma-32 factor
MSDSSNQLMPLSLSAPGVNLGAYISTVNQIPILTAEQEKELAERYYYDQDLDAAKLLVMSHLRFVVHIARSYAGYGLPQGDLIQEGNLGLMKAVKRFDPNMGVRLVSFAVHWIKAEIHEYVIRNWRIVKIATTKAQRKLFFNLRSLKKSSKKLTLKEAQSIANDLNVTPEQVLEMEGRLTAYDAAFEAQGDDDDEGSTHVAPALYLEDNRYDPARLAEEEDYEEQSTNALHDAMEQLDDRSRNILQRRWLDDEKSTLHELAAEYNVSANVFVSLKKMPWKKLKWRCHRTKMIPIQKRAKCPFLPINEAFCLLTFLKNLCLLAHSDISKALHMWIAISALNLAMPLY